EVCAVRLRPQRCSRWSLGSGLLLLVSAEDHHGAARQVHPAAQHYPPTTIAAADAHADAPAAPITFLEHRQYTGRGYRHPAHRHTGSLRLTRSLCPYPLVNRTTSAGSAFVLMLLLEE
ncbi:hypothetical protein Vretifemale_7468, partial [Volvox reticuliferus]